MYLFRRFFVYFSHEECCYIQVLHYIYVYIIYVYIYIYVGVCGVCRVWYKGEYLIVFSFLFIFSALTCQYCI